MERAKVDDPEEPITAERTAKYVWFEDDHELVDRLTKRVNLLTGLSMETCEPLQVQNYGVGGRYVYHHDHIAHEDFDDMDRDLGARVATFMFYVSIFL